MLCAGGDFYFYATGQGGDFDFGSQNGLGKTDRHPALKILPVAIEERVLFYSYLYM